MPNVASPSHMAGGQLGIGTAEKEPPEPQGKQSSKQGKRHTLQDGEQSRGSSPQSRGSTNPPAGGMLAPLVGDHKQDSVFAQMSGAITGDMTTAYAERQAAAASAAMAESAVAMKLLKRVAQLTEAMAKVQTKLQKKQMKELKEIASKRANLHEKETCTDPWVRERDPNEAVSTVTSEELQEWQEAAKVWEGRATTLQARVDVLSSTSALLKKQAAQAATEMSVLKEQLEAEKARAMEAAKEAESAKTSLALQQALAKTTGAMPKRDEAAERELQMKAAEAQVLAKAVEIKEREIENLKQEHRDELTRVQMEQQVMMTKLGEATEKMMREQGQLRAKVHSLQTQNHNLELELEDTTAENEDMQDSFQTQQDTITGLKEKISTAQEWGRTLAAGVQSMTSDLQAAQKELEGQKVANAKLVAEAEQLRAKQERVEKTKDLGKGVLMEQHEMLESRLAAQDQEIDALTKELRATQKKCATFETNFLQARGYSQQLEARLRGDSDAMAKAERARGVEEKRRAEGLQATIADLQRKLDEKDKQKKGNRLETDKTLITLRAKYVSFICGCFLRFVIPLTIRSLAPLAGTWHCSGCKRDSFGTSRRPARTRRRR